MSSPAGNRVNVLVLSFTLISGVVVFFRLFTRTVLIRNWGFEDVCISFAMVSVEDSLIAARVLCLNTLRRSSL